MVLDVHLHSLKEKQKQRVAFRIILLCALDIRVYGKMPTIVTLKYENEPCQKYIHGFDMDIFHSEGNLALRSVPRQTMHRLKTLQYSVCLSNL